MKKYVTKQCNTFLSHVRRLEEDCARKIMTCFEEYPHNAVYGKQMETKEGITIVPQNSFSGQVASVESLETLTVTEYAKLGLYRRLNKLDSLSGMVELLNEDIARDYLYYYVDKFGNMQEHIQEENYNYVFMRIESFELSEAIKLLAYAKRLLEEEKYQQTTFEL